MKGGFLSKPAEVVNAENALEKAQKIFEDAQALKNKNDNEGAWKLFEQVLPTYRKHADKGKVAVCLEQLGLAASKVGGGKAGTERAWEALSETVKILDDLGLGGHVETARVLMNLGVVCVQLEKWADAIRVLERAQTNYEKAQKTVGTEEYGNTVRLLQMARRRKADEDD